jgi:uncharacterized protein (TIRG00374 family)
VTDTKAEGRDGGDGEPKLARARGGLVRKIVIGTVLGAIVFAALSLYGDLEELAVNLGRFEWSALVIAIALASGNYVLRFVRWHYYLRYLGFRVPAGESALVFLSGFVMSVTPGKVGEVFKSALLFESRELPFARTAAIVVAERVTDLAALVLLTAIGSLAFDRGPFIALVGAGLVGLLLVTCMFRPLGELFLRVFARLPLLSRIAPRLRDAYNALHSLTRPTPLLVATVLALIAWFLEVLSLHVILGGLGEPRSLETSTFAYSASTIAGAAAMSPGGLGVTEAGITGFLQVIEGGMDRAPATAATMLVRLATLWWAVIVGLVALAWFRALLRARAKKR